MSEPPLTRAQAKQRTIERLLEAGATVFEEKGYAAASLTEIAYRAGYSKGAIYANFANKEALFAAVHERRNATNTTSLAHAVADATDAHAVRTALREWNARTLRRNTARLKLDGEFWLLAERNEQMCAAVGETFTRGTALTAQLIEHQAQRLGVTMRLPPLRAAQLLIAVVYGLQTQARFDPTILDVDIFDTALGLVFDLAE